VDLKYLTERPDPQKYSCGFTLSSTNVAVTITYVGGGNLADLVAKILPGATKSADNIVYSFNIPRWW